MAYRLTLLEIQKAGLLPSGNPGEPLRLKYEEGIYGPYAHNLNKVLETLEGTLHSRYGATARNRMWRSNFSAGAEEEAERFLREQ